jgi:hypothetical protein
MRCLEFAEGYEPPCENTVKSRTFRLCTIRSLATWARFIVRDCPASWLPFERTTAPPTHSTAGKSLDPQLRQTGPIAALWRIVTRVDRSKINAWQALRNTVGVVAPLIAGYALGMPRGGLAVASGALNVSYSDGSDPYAQRAKRMLASTVWCSIAVLLGGLTAHSNTMAVAIATVWAFGAGMSK